MIFHKTRIATIDRPSSNTMTLVLDIDLVDNPEFEYSPGQHVVVQIMHDGKEVRRPYALSSSPFADERPAITIERIKGGIFSEYIFDHALEGMTLNISNAHGFFYADINSNENQNYYLIAQEIGICPLFSILKSVLHAETLSHVYLFYESRNRDSILFEQEIAQLNVKFANRFSVIHTLSHSSIIPRLVSWSGQKGKINQASIKNFLGRFPAGSKDQFYISGSEDMNTEMRSALIALSIDSARSHYQQFYTKPSKEEKIGDFQSVTIALDGETKTYQGAANRTLLEALKSGGYPAPYACESGICGTCAARLQAGDVTMKRRSALEAIDIEKGWILTCQACPTTGDIKIKFE